MNDWTIYQIEYAVSLFLKQVSPGLCTHLEIVPPYIFLLEAVMDRLKWQHLVSCSYSETQALSMSVC